MIVGAPHLERVGAFEPEYDSVSIKDLKQQVSTRRQGESDRSDRPDDVTHRA